MTPPTKQNPAVHGGSIKNLKLIAGKVWRDKGVKGIAKHIMWRMTRRQPRILPACIEVVKDGIGFEIGGPTPLFSRHGDLPIYPHIRILSNCNFDCRRPGTVFTYDCDRNAGGQYRSEATDLPFDNSNFDFVLSSHCVEHVANPLKALFEWKRILRRHGHLLLVVPHYKYTFDHRRPLTSERHLIHDHAQEMGENDTTHIAEVLKLHNINRDWNIANYAELLARSKNNLVNRCIHHHVFDECLAKWMLTYCGFEVIDCEFVRPHHILILARKN